MNTDSNQKTAVVFLLGFFLAGTAAQTTALADAGEEERADVIAACSEAAQFLEANDLDKALEEAEWCREGIQQIKQRQTLAIFPDSVNGYEGGEITNSGALGIVVLGRKFEKGEKTISVELTSGSVPGLGSLGDLMSAFSAAGQAAGLGAGLGEGEKLRIQRRTVINSSSNNSADLTVLLKNGGLLKVESASVSAEEAIEFLKAFPITELDDAIGG